MRQYLVLHVLYMCMSCVCACVVMLISRRVVGDAYAWVLCVVTFNVMFSTMTMGTAMLSARVDTS